MKKRLILIILLSLIGGILYVPFLKATDKNITELIWIIFPLGSGLTISLVAWLGFKFADKSNLPMPILRKWETNQKIKRTDFGILYLPIILCVAFSIITFGLNQVFIAPKNPGTFIERILTTPWAGLVTETISHLFIMSGIMLIIKRKWVSIALSSLILLILFHLNNVESNVTLTAYLGIMNFLGATLTGWLYSRYGFESAVAGHSSMHFIILALN